MWSLRIEYVMGRCVATRYSDRDAPEWPPHPARVFSALVAAWADGDPPCPDERAALEWLQMLDPPEIVAGDAAVRPTVTHFVPVNDPSVVSSYDRAWKKVHDTGHRLDEAQASVEAALSAEDKATIKRAQRELKKAKTASDRATKALAKRSRAAVAASDKAPKKSMETAVGLLPGHRTRQPRTFPSVTPDDPVVYLSWETAPDPQVRHALERLASRVSRIGHSSSLVACRLAEDAPKPRWFPDDHGDLLLRVPAPDQLRRLEQAHARHREVDPRVLPCRFQRYRLGATPLAQDIPASVFSPGDWIILRRVGQAHGDSLRPPSTRAVDLAHHLRAALMKHCDDPPPPLLSGHTPDGAPLERPHLAVVPLPFVASRHADGSILGLALIFPRDVDSDERRQVLRGLGRWEHHLRIADERTPTLRLTLGRDGVVELERVVWEEPPLVNLRPETWCLPAKTWISVTPVALDRHPGRIFSRNPATAAAARREAESTVADACVNIGLPRPKQVTLIPSVPVPGAAKARRFPPFPPEPGRTRRFRVHVEVTFDDQVRGPLLIGAGRYFGLGLMRPLPQRGGVS